MNTRLLVEHPQGYEHERAYILEVMLADFLGLEYVAVCANRRDIRITLDGANDGKQLVSADSLFQTPAEQWLTPASMPSADEPMYWSSRAILPDAGVLPDTLPVMYHDPSLADCISSESISISLDLFGSAFFMLTRYEELVVRDRDEHGRFSAGSSFSARAGMLERPIVNEYLEVLWAGLARLWPQLARKQRSHRVSLSHDVDWPLCTAGRPARKAVRTIAGDVMTRKSPGLALQRSLSHVQTLRGCPDSDLCNTFGFIMDTNERHGIATAFYFITDHSGGEIDGNYSLSDRWVRKLMLRMHERGHEVGLHPSYETFRNPVQTQYEFDRLRAAANCLGIRQEQWGGRQHFLRWECPTTWRNWADAGLDYDSTLGYSDHAGFRCGTCYDFPVFDLQTREQLRLREHPLIAMEVTLTGYMGLSWVASLQKIMELDATCRRYQGEFTLLWHNNMLVTDVEKRTYSAVIEGLAQ